MEGLGEKNNSESLTAKASIIFLQQRVFWLKFPAFKLLDYCCYVARAEKVPRISQMQGSFVGEAKHRSIQTYIQHVHLLKSVAM